LNGNKQSRKWQLTINSPLECGLTHEAIIEILALFKPLYWCLTDEIGESGNYHTHVFLYASPTRFSTLKKRFYTAHIESAKGSILENRDYILKAGEKWSDKANTSVVGSFKESGEPPEERTDNQPDASALVIGIWEGKSNLEILQEMPKMALQLQKVDYLRQSILAEKYASDMRDVKASYWYGATGSGKTTNIFNIHEARDICRITSYRKGRVLFDAYNAHDVLVLEEFHSQIPIWDMLNILDRFPLKLPARYSDRQACYRYVYITSNKPLHEQYRDTHHETFRAFLRRIHSVIEFYADGSTTDRTDNYKQQEGFNNA